MKKFYNHYRGSLAALLFTGVALLLGIVGFAAPTAAASAGFVNTLPVVALLLPMLLLMGFFRWIRPDLGRLIRLLQPLNASDEVWPKPLQGLLSFCCAILLICTALVLPVSSAQAQNCSCPGTNLILGGSFESAADMNEWDIDPPGATRGVTANSATCGSNAGFVTPGSGILSLYQRFSATVGTTYYFSAFAGTGDPNQLDDMRLFFLDASFNDIGVQSVNIDNNYNSGPLTLYTLSATAPSGAVFVEVKFRTQVPFGATAVQLRMDGACLTTTAPVSCTNPTATAAATNPTCTGNTANSNGTITLVTASNGTHYGVSTLGAATYDGTAFASAAAISLPQTVRSSIPNGGGNYIVRVFNGANDCYTDVTVAAPNISCACPTPPCGGTTAVKN